MATWHLHELCRWGVDQLGSIYEGLLMYHVVVPRDDWEKHHRRRGLRVALVPSNQERKSSGSYFTPQHIVQYIVANTVGPLLEEKFAAARPRLREAQRRYADAVKFQRQKAEKLRREPPPPALPLQPLPPSSPSSQAHAERKPSSASGTQTPRP